MLDYDPFVPNTPWPDILAAWGRWREGTGPPVQYRPVRQHGILPWIDYTDRDFISPGEMQWRLAPSAKIRVRMIKVLGPEATTKFEVQTWYPGTPEPRYGGPGKYQIPITDWTEVDL